MNYLSILCKYNNLVHCNKKDFDHMYNNLDFDIVTPGEILALRFTNSGSKIDTDIFVKVVSVKKPHNDFFRGVYLGNLVVELPNGKQCLLKKENDGDAHRVVSRPIASYYAQIMGVKQTFFGLSLSCSVISFKNDEDTLKRLMIEEKERQAARKREKDAEEKKLAEEKRRQEDRLSKRQAYADQPLDQKKYKEINDLFRKM